MVSRTTRAGGPDGGGPELSRSIGDYALIGDTETAALVSSGGSIDWFCLPRFDSGACFAALLGDEDNGHWSIHPRGDVERIRRRYRPGTLVLETEFDTPGGTVRIVDSMPPRGTERGGNPDLVRVVEGVSGSVPMRMDLAIRFDYGWVVPWVTRGEGCLQALAGPDALTLTTPVETRGEGLTTVADFEVRGGDRIPFVITWHPSHEPAPEPADGLASVEATTRLWREWSARSSYTGEWEQAVDRSLITLKALTFAPSGGIVAAPTTSLPERLGGRRNWDYRFVWLRDATFTLSALVQGGYRDEAVAWRDWLLRAVAGDPQRLQIMYGVAGERRLPELELDWLDGYEGSRPVRIGNAAAGQHQSDVHGEVMDTMDMARRAGMEPDEEAWHMQRAFLRHLEDTWDEPDHGLWEVRGPSRHFTHSKILAWVAFDRAAKAVADSGLEGPAKRWRRLRDEIHAEVCAKAYDADRNTFTQFYGSREVDAALLLIPQYGFLPASDERFVGTMAAVEEDLCVGDTGVLRYRTDPAVDGLPPGEGAFLLCSFWLVDALAMTGRQAEARARFERLLALRNDVGLLAEQFDPVSGRLLGNFPQAFSHVGLINSACRLAAEQSGRPAVADRGV